VVRVAIDLCILGIGSTGGIFVNPTIITTYGEHAGLVSACVTGIDFLVGAVLLFFRYRRTMLFEKAARANAAGANPPHIPPAATVKQAVIDIILGNFTLAVAIVVIAYGLHKQHVCRASMHFSRRLRRRSRTCVGVSLHGGGMSNYGRR
jgi:hypothetical protein